MTSGQTLAYNVLVVAAGLKLNWDAIPGLSGALADPASGVSSIYSYNTCDKVWNDIENLRSSKAVFTRMCKSGTAQHPGDDHNPDPSNAQQRDHGKLPMRGRALQPSVDEG